MSKQTLSSNHCPVCGKDNACNLADKTRLEEVAPDSTSVNCCAAGSGAGFNCWCANVHLNEESKKLLKAKTDGTRCLCQRCLESLIQASQSTADSS